MKKSKLGILALGMMCCIVFSCEKNREVAPEKIEEVQKRSEKNTEKKVQTNIDNDLILKLVNEVRAKGCDCTNKETNQIDKMPPVAALTWNENLAETAKAHSNDMSVKNYFSHTTPSGIGFGQRISDNGYSYTTAAENIAMGQKTEREVVLGWLGSYGHCKNIMLGTVKEMGVARSDGHGFYWTQLFGTQKYVIANKLHSVND